MILLLSICFICFYYSLIKGKSIAFNIKLNNFGIVPQIHDLLIAIWRWSHAVEVPSLERIFDHSFVVMSCHQPVNVEQLY